MAQNYEVRYDLHENKDEGLRKGYCLNTTDYVVNSGLSVPDLM